MPRSLPEWIGANDDTPIPPRVKDRVFRKHKGRCHVTGRRIRPPRDAWDCDHVIAIINGGENRESNLAPILRGKVHKEKTDADLKEKSKVSRVRLKHLGIYPPSPFKIRSRGFPKRLDSHA